jgi:hypothetical protein
MKQIAILCAALAAIFLLWGFPVVYPLKLLVVFFHESSHALMTVMTGGEVQEMVVNASQGGHVMSLGGNRFLTLSAGYLGSLVWGVIIYLIAVRTHQDKALMFVLGASIIAIAAFYIRDMFAIVFSLGTGVAMLVVAVKASALINDAALRVIGLTNMMYVPLDIYSDTIERSHLRSDAFMLAEEFGGSTLLWGGLWTAMSVAIVVFTLWLGFSASEEEEEVTD